LRQVSASGRQGTVTTGRIRLGVADDSGPNLLVRGVMFLLLLVVLAAVVWLVRWLRRRR
jgi:hypothetical protein